MAAGLEPEGVANRDVVVVGGSAGALEALKKIVADLPVDLRAAVVVVVHMPTTGPSLLPSLLDRIGGMPAVSPRDGDRLAPGYIYVAPPDHHVKLEDSRIRLDHGPRVNGVRPAADVLFRSAAAAFGPRVVGVVLSGGLDDGTAGLAAVRAVGGVGIVQAPEDAVIQGMPESAIERAEPEHVAPADQIGGLITSVVTGSLNHERGRVAAKGGVVEVVDAVGAGDGPGQISGITCPECHGSLWVRSEQGALTYECRIGHALSPDTLYDLQAENVEQALWAGVRALEEQASLSRFMAEGARRRGDEEPADRYDNRRRRAEANAESLRRLLMDRD